MRLPIIHGLIRRRLLVNFRVDADVMRRFLPPPFRPKLHRGHAIAGVCLIRLEQIRPGWLPRFCGIASENAAHRIAVIWDEPSGASREGVFIPRRDTGSWLNHLAGGRIFPGEHHLADFTVTDDGARISMSIRARDGRMAIQLRARGKRRRCRSLPALSRWPNRLASLRVAAWATPSLANVAASMAFGFRRRHGRFVRWRSSTSSLPSSQTNRHSPRAVPRSTMRSSCAMSATSGMRRRI